MSSNKDELPRVRRDGNMIRKRLDELRLSGALPSPAGVGMRILEITRSPDFCLDELARTLQADPALTGRILRLANSSALAGAESVRSVQEAAMRLGATSVRNVALGFTLVSGNRSGACKGFDYDRYWSQSLATAVAAQVLAKRLPGLVATDAFTCGLLSGIGRLALASIHTDRFEQVLARAAREGADLVELERIAFDLDHRELGQALLDDWRLPAAFGFAVAVFELASLPDEVPDKTSGLLALTLRLAARLARAELLEPTDGQQRELQELVAELDLQPERIQGLGAELRSEWVQWGRLLDIPTQGQPSVADGEPRLPLPEAADGAADPLLQNVPRRRGLRILAVDDDLVSLRLLVHHLQRDGHTIALAHNGREALEGVLREDPQMVITDWTMPELDGIELCRTLRRTEEVRGIYILLLTGRGDHERIVEAFDAGADDYVSKPFNPEVLLARVRAGQRMIELREQVEEASRERERQVARMAVLNRKLKAAAMTDILTRLPNRRYAMARLDQDVAGALRSEHSLCLIVIDIDHFKSVNDLHGHDVGDRVLEEVAEVLRLSIRKGDVPARLGGEEFLVICPQSDLEGARQVAQRICDAVAGHDFGELETKVTVSLGVAQLGPGCATLDTLLKEADRRVYVAKARGRNQVCADRGEDKQRERRRA